MSKRRTLSKTFRAQVVLEAFTGAKTATQIYNIEDSGVSRWNQEFIGGASQVFAGSAAWGTERTKLDRTYYPEKSETWRELPSGNACV